MIKVLHGHPFYPNAKKEPILAKGAQVFAKHLRKHFGFFNNFTDFVTWFKSYRQECIDKNVPFCVSERIQDGLAYSFYADIEGLSPLETSTEDLECSRYMLKKIFRDVYSEFKLNYENLVWMEDHRVSKGMIKTSYHVIGSQDLFIDIVRRGSMHALAVDLNLEMSKRVSEEKLKIEFTPDKHSGFGSVLDLSVYHSGREFRSVYANKDNTLGGGFSLCEDSKDFDFEDCLVTKDIRKEDFCDYDFINYESGNIVQRKTSGPRVYPRRKISPELTEERTYMEKRFREHIRDELGDKTSTVRFKDVHCGEDCYEVRGPERKCPVCSKTHDGNGAYIKYKGGGNFTYKCLSPSASNLNEVQLKFKSTDDTPDFLPSFEHVKKKCIQIQARMGTGKTFQTQRFIDSLPGGTSVLWITPRKTMARTLYGRMKDYSLYLYEVNSPKQIVEYESLHHVDREYDVVVMDEIRSTLKSTVCFATNRENMIQHIEILQDLCKSAKHVLLLDADMQIDSMVDCFVKNLFEESEIHRIVHDGGGMKSHYIFLQEKEEMLCKITQDLKDGNRLMVCCGSSKESKVISSLASEIVGDEKVGVYYADAPIQGELDDVNTHWEKYQIILFTSTITCSVDYQGHIDRIYVFPCFMTATPREMAQMIGRSRKNSSGEVVVYCPTFVKMLDVDLHVAYGIHKRNILERRKKMTKFKDLYDLQFYGCIKKRGLGWRVEVFPHLLTDMWAWSLLEESLSKSRWMSYFLYILEYKKSTWNMGKVQEIEKKKEMGENTKKMRDTTKDLKDEEVDLLTRTKALGVSETTIRVLTMKKIRGDASQEELYILRKHESQRYFKEEISGRVVLMFEKNKRGIKNRIFIQKFNRFARRKLHSNFIEMREALDMDSCDTVSIEKLQTILKILGFQGVDDTTTEVEWGALDQKAKKKTEKIVKELGVMNLKLRISTSDIILRIKAYLKGILALKLSARQIDYDDWKRKGYRLEHIGPVEKNCIYDEKWLTDHCERFDKLTGNPPGSELSVIEKLQSTTDQREITEFYGHVDKKRKCVSGSTNVEECKESRIH